MAEAEVQKVQRHRNQYHETKVVPVTTDNPQRSDPQRKSPVSLGLIPDTPHFTGTTPDVYPTGSPWYRDPLSPRHRHAERGSTSLRGPF